MSKKVGIKVKFQPMKYDEDKTEMGVSVNGWSYNYQLGMTDEQLRCIAIAIFRHLAKKKENGQTED